jgi:arylsulfatase A
MKKMDTLPTSRCAAAHRPRKHPAGGARTQSWAAAYRVPDRHQNRFPALAVAMLLVLSIKGCGGPVASSGGDPGPASQRVTPNIVLILSDDQGWNQIGVHGATDFYETPNIDRIVREGVYFTDAYSASPVCSPARASILTGKNPARLHLTDYIPGGSYPHAPVIGPPMRGHLSMDERILPQYLADLGYVSGHFGKWHLSPDRLYDEPGRYFDPQHRGFADVLLNDKPEPDHDPFDDPHRVEAITERSIEFIRQNRDRPFFLYVSHHVVHRPLIEEPDLIAKYEAKPGAGHPMNNPLMGAMVERMDAGIGRILDTLDDLDLSANTVVIFFSDNGGLEVLQAQDPLRGGKAMVFEGGIRVPFTIRWPGVIEAGRSTDVPVISDDFLPTILEIVGHHTDRAQFDGVSLLPLLLGGEAPERKALYWHYPHYHHHGYQPSGAIRKGDYKLIEWYEETQWGAPGQVSLFNVREDIGETTDLAVAMPARAAEMRSMLHTWRAAVGAQEMRRNPLYDPERAYFRSETQLHQTRGPGVRESPVP